MGLGDPNYRGLSKKEIDPLLTSRIRDIARGELCKNFGETMGKCYVKHGLLCWIYCREEVKDLHRCVDEKVAIQEFRDTVTQEYLNERSHYRQTGHRSPRYERSNYVKRTEEDPAIGPDGKYKMKKPYKWDESYKGKELPEWAKNVKYD